MKTSFLTPILIFLLGSFSLAQPIPTDSLYLGQTPPGSTPVIFNLSVNTGSFAAERIAISDDNKEIYYTEVHNYYPISGDTIRYYRYSGSNWTGPFILFQNYLAPALSVNCDTMYFQNNSSAYKSFFSVRNGINWSNPQRLLANLNSAHYLQVTNSGNYYISSHPESGIGANDWCRLSISGADTTALSLGLPLNTSADNLDFFVSGDETFMILSKGGLKISYHKNDGSWTNPKSLGPEINFGLNEWGAYVSSDNKYLFYTTGTNPDYSDVYVYWVRIDNLMDSLKYTNFLPYVKNPIPDQTAIKGELFTFAFPDSTFIDDDGNNTLVYHAKLNNGGPLPGWLTFDTIAGSFTGTPANIETLNIRVTATDTAGAAASTNFKIIVNNPVSIDQINRQSEDIMIFPNPTNGLINISLDAFSGKPAIVEIRNPEGKVVLKKSFENKMSIDLTGNPGGIYLLKLFYDHEMICRKVVLNN
jgi:hypothetical protein